MPSFTRWLLLLIAALVVGFGLFLATWDIPAPVQRIEHPVPDERLPR